MPSTRQAQDMSDELCAQPMRPDSISKQLIDKLSTRGTAIYEGVMRDLATSCLQCDFHTFDVFPTIKPAPFILAEDSWIDVQ